MGYILGFLACAAAFMALVWTVSDGQKMVEEHIEQPELLDLEELLG